MDENVRLEITKSLGLLDTMPEQEFDEIVELASTICGTPMSSFTLIDAERQWFKASVGMSSRETRRDVSFCAHAIQQPGIFVVEDATDDDRFANNPLVTGAPGIRFYAGMPLQTPSGAAIGTLCVIDTVARKMTQAQQNCLTILSRQIETLINLRLKQKALEASLAEIDLKTQALNAALEDNELLVKSLRSNERLFRSFVDINPNHIFIKSADGRYNFYNQSFADHFQIGEHEWIGKSDHDVFPKDLADSFQSHDRLVLEQNEVKSQVFPNNGEGGPETHFKCLKFPYEDAQGNRMIGCISVDISSQVAVETRLRRSNRELERLATTDTLTGLQLRRGFEKRMEAEFSRCISNGKVHRSLSVFLIDVDNFKTRNDTFGHAAGDEALRYLGKMLLENARIEDLPVRIGGDEFALLLPETGMEQARIIAERIRSLARKFGEGTAILSLSIGIATLDSGMKNWQELIERADISLYRAKAAGRNRVATSNDTGIHLARTSPAKLSIAS